MMMKEDSYEFVQTVHVGHPYYLPNFMDGLTYSLPFVMENLSRLAEDLITICLPKADEEVPEDEQEEVERLRGKILALSRLRHVMSGLGEDRRQSIQMPVVPPAASGAKGPTKGQIAKFEAALQMDFMREYLKPGAELGANSTKAPLYRGRSKSVNFLDLGKGGSGRDPRSLNGPPRPNFLPQKAAGGAVGAGASASRSSADAVVVGGGAAAGEGPRTSGRRERARAVKFGAPPPLEESGSAAAAAPGEGGDVSKKEKRRSRDDWSVGK